MTKNITVKTSMGDVVVRPVVMEGKGFIRRYRQVLAARRAFETPDKATPDDLDAAVSLIMSCVVSGMTEDDFFDKATEEDLGAIFGAIMGIDTAVPPGNGGA